MSAKFNRRRFIAAGTAAAAMPFLVHRASAQAAWPSRQIRMICSYPAGGQTDLLARAFGEFISRQLGQTVIIENKAGASGSIGAAEVARAEPDGHTILCSISTTYIMNRVMMKNPGYDMDKDLTLVSVIPGAGLLLIASPKSGVTTLDEFVAFARKSGKVNFGTYSAGSSTKVERTSFTFGSLLAATHSSDSRSTIGCGVAFGNAQPVKPPTVKNFEVAPCSGSVLMFGIASTFFECTANTTPRLLCRTGCAAV